MSLYSASILQIVSQTCSSLSPLLAHVLVPEMTPILEGVPFASEDVN